MTNASTPSRAIRLAAWLAFSAVLLGFVLWDATVRTEHILKLTGSFGVTVDAPAIDPASPTGYADGRRALVIPGGSADTAHWIIQTQDMIQRGDWRLHHVDSDNAPKGREVHWAAPYHWWLATLAWVDHTLSGRPIGISVERAALLAGPVLLILFLAVAIPFIARRFSPTAAVLVGFGSMAAYPFYVDFLPGHADHHGLINILAMSMVLFIVLGSRNSGRKWFILSAIAGGLAMWLSAATATPVLVGLGCGMLAAAWFGRSSPAPVVWMRDPRLFRLWGWVGGGVSLAAYVFEYFPGGFGMRLEVNHPLYSLAWIGAGEALCAVVQALRVGLKGVSRTDRIRAVAGVAGILVLPLTLAATHATTFALSDPIVWRIHKLYITEIQALPSHYASKLIGQWIGIALPTLLLVPTLLKAFSRSTSRESRAMLLLVWTPAALGWLMGWAQVRWLGLAFALTIPLVATFLWQLEQPEAARPRARLLWTALIALLFVPAAVSAVRRAADSDEFTTEEIRNVAERDVAHWLRLRAGRERLTVATGPAPTTMLAFYGGSSGLGTLFWENGEGLRNATHLFGTPSLDEAHELVTKLGVTHIAFYSWSALEVSLAKLDRGLPPDAPIPKDSFIARLLAAPVPPPWLRQIPVKLPDNPALAGAYVRVWEVTDDTTPQEALTRQAAFLLESGRADIAGRLMPALVQYENDLPSMVMLAAIASQQRDAAAFQASFGRVLALLPRSAGLTSEELVQLSVVLVVGKQLEDAQRQLAACMRNLDEHQLRHFTPGTLNDLLALSDGLKVPFPSPELQQLTRRLIPPSQRK